MQRQAEAAAETLLRDRRFEEAASAYRAILAQQPETPRSLLNLGGALIEIGRFEEAEDVLLRAVRREPGHAGAWSNLGVVMLERQRYEDAVAAFVNSLRIAPCGVPALRGLGVTLRRRGLPAQALPFLDMAVAQAPKDAALRHDRALALLGNGDYAAGFREYEFRERRADHASAHRPVWDGSGFDGRTLLVEDEAGLGDMLQFARFLPLAKARGGRVLLRVPRPLQTLLSRLDGVDQVVTPEDALPPFDLRCPILGLPHRLGTTLASLPGASGYLTPDPALVAAWRERLAAGAARCRIGLVWAGGHRPWHRENALWDARRSLRLDALLPLLRAAEGAELHSLQLGPPAAQIRDLPSDIRIVDNSARIGSFDDTAAIIAQLDLVIAVDTSTAHLAGALGRPVWMLSRYDQCWRWLTGRSDSPWYDTMRLYQQPAPFDWATPVQRMIDDLRCLPARPCGA